MGLLGPVGVVSEGSVRLVAGRRRKAVLAALGLAAGEVVSADRLLDVVWQDEAAGLGRNAVQTHVSHLRGVLGRRDAIVAHGSGYALDLGAETTDVQRVVKIELDP